MTAEITSRQSGRAGDPPVQEPLVQVQAGCWGHTIGGRSLFLTRAVDFVVHPGEIVMLTGANGSGKTTILRGLLGLVAQRAGRVDLRVAPLDVGYVPQESVIDRSIPATVLDIVRTGDPARWARGRPAALQALAAVDMAEGQGRLFARLSGGQRQRVLIARALVGRPRLLLLDEPTINVDAPTAQRIGSLLARLADEGLGILVTSHVTDWIAATRAVAIAPAEEAP